jgi:hypothetical protein
MHLYVYSVNDILSQNKAVVVNKEKKEEHNAAANEI